MSLIESIRNSQRFRDRVSGIWLLICIAASVALLHFGTDFEVNNTEWWRYLIDVIRIEKRLPTPYVWFLPLIFALYFAGTNFGRLVFRRKEYGDARKARPRDLATMRLDGTDNMIIGHMNNKPIIPKDDRHAVVIAGTRSGKSQAIVIPTLMNYRESVVVIDPKGELWDNTAGARSEFSDCYRLEWTAAHTARFNPISLDVLPDAPAALELRVIQTASILVPPGDDYWSKEGHKAARALMLLEIYDAKSEGRDADLANVAHFSGEIDLDGAGDDEDRDVTTLNDRLREAAQRAKDRGYPRLCQTDLAELATMASRQLSGVLGTMSAHLQVLKTEAVSAAISKCDIHPKMLVEGDRPVSIYIVVKPNDAQFTSALTTTLITNFVLDLVSRSPAEAANHHSALFILEEFSAMKKTPAIPELLDRGAGLGVHAMIVVQSLAQVRKIYSEDDLKTFVNNADFLVVFAVTDADTQQWLERLVGKTTRRRESRSEADRGHDSSSVSFEGVPLIMAQEWGEIPFGQHRVLVRYHNTRPIFATSNFAFEDPALSAKMRMHPPTVRPLAAPAAFPPASAEIDPDDEAELAARVGAE